LEGGCGGGGAAAGQLATHSVLVYQIMHAWHLLLYDSLSHLPGCIDSCQPSSQMH
jgi:hypothetical protein